MKGSQRSKEGLYRRKKKGRVERFASAKSEEFDCLQKVASMKDIPKCSQSKRQRIWLGNCFCCGRTAIMEVAVTSASRELLHIYICARKMTQ